MPMLYQGNVLELYDQLAKQHLYRYFNVVNQIKIKRINYTENITYLLEVEHKRYILRITSVGYHTREEIEAEIAFNKSIADADIVHVPSVINGRDGQTVQEVYSQALQAPVYSVLFAFLDGDVPDEENQPALISYYEKLGEITAELHRHVETDKSLDHLDRPVWNYDTTIGDRANWGKWQEGVGLTADIAALFEETAETINYRLNRFGQEKNVFGLIHGDLRLSNLLVDQDRVNVIDFDDCGFSWYLYDLACGLSFIEHKAYVPTLVQAWIKGYQKERTLSEADIQEIPTFIMLRRLVLVGWVGNRKDRDLAKELGEEYTLQTVEMAKKYLTTHRISV